MRRVAILLGAIAGIASMVLWIVFNFFNPYENPNDVEALLRTFFMLFLPACLALAASFTKRHGFLLIAFIWSFPLSLYLVLTPGIFALFGLTCLAYLLSFLLLVFPVRTK